MKTAAVVVGVNAYPNKPLTSAINDAKAFREALIKHKLVADKDIQMFTSPSEYDWPEATRKNLNDALYAFYKNSDDVDKFFFYFAGHGMLTYVKGEMRTVLMPVDVADLERDAGYLIDLGELQGYLRHGGPQQQFYFIDACRDLNPEEHPPTVGSLSWKLRNDLVPALAQATLFAVSELGKARSQVEGMGEMTGILIEALEGTGVATDYDDERSDWVVSMKTVRDYVKDAIEQKLVNEPHYLRAYMMPQLDDPDPKTEPLRIFGDVAPKWLTINIIPTQVTSDTDVVLRLKSIKVDKYCLPPQKSHQKFALPPQRYLVEAVYNPDPKIIPIPSRKTIDVRKERELDIFVQLPDAPPPPPPRLPDAGPSPPDISFESRGLRSPLIPIEGTGSIEAHTLERAVAIELESLQAPYKKWSESGSLSLEVPTGSYRLRFRLGTDVFNEAEVYVKAGETVKVSPTIAAPPLVREALALREHLPTTTVISDSIGDIQAGLLQTMLPLIGVKPFDIHNEILHDFAGLAEPQSPELFDLHPLSVVIAVDGNRWGSDVQPLDILRSINCRTEVSALPRDPISDSGFTFTPVQELELRSLTRATLRHDQMARPDGLGFERVGLAVTAAPAPSFTLIVNSPYLGSYRLTCAAIGGRVTVVNFTFRPDGSVDIGQNILRLPGRPELYADEKEPEVPYGRMVRELQLGQQLYRSGELIEQKFKGRLSGALDNLLRAKWTDPVVSCMAYLAWRRYAETQPEQSESNATEFNSALLEAASNLHKYFYGLPDSHLVFGLAFPEQQTIEFGYLLDMNRVPVLAESARILASYAEETGREDAAVVRVARRMSVRQSWASVVNAGEVLTPRSGVTASAAFEAAGSAATEATENAEETGAAGA
ncbi:MAG: Caspase domain [Acidobacteriota bacterium]|jgi:hypothetical protein|nr:Caspase domain [Acidobacteriota bacterium]